MNELNKPDTSREHLANERTFLAWIRTSIGIMAFGFVVVKYCDIQSHISLSFIYCCNFTFLNK
jgi:putative membrane protein